MATADALKESLRRTVEAAAANTTSQDVRFEFGTEYTQNFTRPGEESYGYSPLPAVFDPENTRSMRADQQSRVEIFPRLVADPEELRVRLRPALTKLVAACQTKDLPGKGFLLPELLEAALRETGVFLSRADLDMLLKDVPRNGSGQLDYTALVDYISGKGPAASSSTGMTTGRPVMPTTFEWPAEGGDFELVLRLRPAAPGFTMPGDRMQRFAAMATAIRREEEDAEKLHNRLRDAMLRELVTDATRPRAPPLGAAPDLSFRNWLADQGVLSLTVTNMNVPGPVPPEVFDVLDQMIYALGVPRVMPQAMIITPQGASMRHGTHMQLTGRHDLVDVDADARSLTSSARLLATGTASLSLRK